MSYLQYILTEASADGIKLQMAKSFFYAMKDVDQQELNDFIVEQPWFPRDVSKEVFSGAVAGSGQKDAHSGLGRSGHG